MGAQIEEKLTGWSLAAQHAGESQLIKGGDWWRVTIKGPRGQFATDYHTGSGLRRRVRQMGASEYFAPVKPKLVDVLQCLVSDAQCADDTFEDFCDNLGYDSDSRKALDTYLACQQIGRQLRNAGANIAELAELFSDY